MRKEFNINLMDKMFAKEAFLYMIHGTLEDAINPYALGVGDTALSTIVDNAIGYALETLASLDGAWVYFIDGGGVIVHIWKDGMKLGYTIVVRGKNVTITRVC